MDVAASSIGSAKMVCLQCSDQVCARDSNSISVGLRPNLWKYERMVFSASGSSASGRRPAPPPAAFDPLGADPRQSLIIQPKIPLHCRGLAADGDLRHGDAHALIL